jgi:hypothetical protein
MIREADIQRTIVAYLDAVLVDAIRFAVPNAARRTTGGKASNGVAGLTAGIPDLCVVEGGGRALFLEVKTDAGRPSPAQSAILTRMHVLGIPYAVVRSVDDVRAALAHHKFKTREAA